MSHVSGKKEPSIAIVKNEPVARRNVSHFCRNAGKSEPLQRLRLNKSNRFTVLIEKDEDGIYVASVPALPGCHTQAYNLDDLEARIKEVIKLCLADKGTDYLKTQTFVGVHQIEVAI